MTKGKGESQEKIDRILRDWRQGDCVLEEQDFTYRFLQSKPLTSAAIQIAENTETDLVDDPVPGFLVVTQTCDIIRSPKERPYIQVSPLVRLSAEEIKRAKKGLYPRYIHLPALETKNLVGDLDRIMTLEKALVASWKRVPGWTDPSDGRRIARAISRKFQRPAFPDPFVEWIRPLYDRLKKKHDRSSPEGERLRSLREIRVRAEPSWNSPNPKITFYFILTETLPSDAEEEEKLLENWLKRLPSTSDFGTPGYLLTTLENLSAQVYVESDPLDLDHLSAPSRRRR